MVKVPVLLSDKQASEVLVSQSGKMLNILPKPMVCRSIRRNLDRIQNLQQRKYFDHQIKIKIKENKQPQPPVKLTETGKVQSPVTLKPEEVHLKNKSVADFGDLVIQSQIAPTRVTIDRRLQHKRCDTSIIDTKSNSYTQSDLYSNPNLFQMKPALPPQQTNCHLKLETKPLKPKKNENAHFTF